MTQSLKIPDESLKEVMGSYCHDLSVSGNNFSPFPEDHEGLQEALSLLSGEEAPLICFVGGPGSGKSTLMQEAGRHFKDARVLMVDYQRMNAGAQLVGRVEMRLDPLTRGLIERGGIVDGRKIILACDDVTELLSRNSVEGMISHLLKSGTVGFMTTATPEEYKALVAKDPALDARMNIIEMLDHGTRVRRTCDALVKAFQEGSEKPVPLMKTLPLNRPKMAP